MIEYVAAPLYQSIGVDHSTMVGGAQPRGVLDMAGRYIECKTEDDLKRIIAAGDIAVLREGHWIIRDSAAVQARGSATVEAYDSTTVGAYDSATVRAFGSAIVWAHDSATVEAYDSANVDAYDSATVLAYDSTIVEAYDSATVRAHNSAAVRASYSAAVWAFGSATVRAYGSSTVRAYGSTTVWACDFSTVHAYGSATVRAIAQASVRVMSDSVKAEASGWATIILHAAGNVAAEPSVAIVERIIRTIDDWAHVYKVDRRDGKLVLYKWVQPDGYTQNGVRYEEGQMVEAPDWDPNPSIELGFGLHACATLEDASEFFGPPRLAVELLVDPDDCRAPQPDDIYPHNVRFRRAFVSRVWDADSEAGAQLEG